MSKRLKASVFPVIFHLHAAQKIVNALGDGIRFGNAVESVNKQLGFGVTGDVRLDSETALIGM